MDKLPKQFTDSLAETRLEDGAKARIRENLVAYMEAHPVSVEPILSPYERFLSILSPLSGMRLPAFALVALLLVSLGGVTTMAAHGSLPGDALYPVKVGILEPTRGLFARTPEEKAEWNVALTEMRLTEVEHLAAKKPSTPEEDVENRARFDKSLYSAQKAIEKLADVNKDAAARIETSLSDSLVSHQTALMSIGFTASSSDKETFTDHIRKTLQLDARSNMPFEPSGDPKEKKLNKNGSDKDKDRDTDKNKDENVQKDDGRNAYTEPSTPPDSSIEPPPSTPTPPVTETPSPEKGDIDEVVPKALGL